MRALADRPGERYDLAPLLTVLERVSFDPERLAQLGGVVRLRDRDSRSARRPGAGGADARSGRS